MTRFWITLDEAVDLVRFALDHAVGGEVFIPKIPSMKVTDLAAAMAPDLPVELIGIRPGEKLLEVLITADESRHTIDAGDVYVVLPEHPWWSDHPRWVEGKPVTDGFSYASDTNHWWLDSSELSAILDVG
jgi:UDP-N-acetylglucosamine 4,6-dehydratase